MNDHVSSAFGRLKRRVALGIACGKAGNRHVTNTADNEITASRKKIGRGP